ncbi:DUF1549 domain-containing protein [Paludisphaera borealis]|uniref:BIG2 domain-containing protein n=1 Tax=Paludisphaera borealis TaxID=1387353 RepID=A0A1U7CME1_9BACT|nr:DUF1549 domain-containing protein [Paludisphaera borealis]APW60102.1 hypothetical protein BSF38_01566 [Paludisphaera borealis]
MWNVWIWSYSIAVLIAFQGGARAGADGLVLLPSEVALGTSESAQSMLLQETVNGEVARRLTDGIEWSSSNPKVATVTDGLVKPAGDGEAVVSAKAGDRSASAKIVVSGMGRPIERSFRNQVEPIFAKMGCNTGACHGALAGKGGFRLSLNGFDPASDCFNIVKLDRGRRVELSDPGRSLVLAKPSGAIPHKGGLRFSTDTREYRIIADWIASGAVPPADSDPRVEALEVLPGSSIHRVGESQPILVRARSSDGRSEDVTRWVKWSSADESVCRVDDQGIASVVGPGEGAVIAWYASKIAIARITVPYGDGTPAVKEGIVVDVRKPRNFIDELIDKQLARLNLPAAPACDDAEFVRRAWIDTVGRPPTTDEVREFLAKTAPDKRDALIDELLARPEFADYWTYKWSDVLTLTSTRLLPPSVKSYYTWLHKHVAANTPWDKLVREILVATGESLENGATNFYGLSQSPEEMTENASQAFLGLSIGCAKCHNHPLEKWTNDQYYAMANLFARVKAKGWGGDAGAGDGKRTLYVAQSGDLIQPRTGKPQPPTPLDGRPLAMDDPSDRRASLADWLTAPDNPYFARAITNRVWANFFGVGLVEKVDDVRLSNPASNEALLKAAADDLVKNKFDLKTLMKSILRSNAYQRSSRPLPGNKGDHRFYSRYYPRRMMAEVLHDAIVQVTQVPTKFENILVPGGSKQKTDFYPPGTRAIQLYDASVDNYFLQSFGRNPRRIVCECDRSAEPSIVQVLHLTNGDTLNEKLSAKGNRVERLLSLRKQGMSEAAIVDEIYLACLSRYPTGAERSRLVAMLPPPGDPDERPVVEDVLWGLLSSREFLFNH